jgi:hypothetical protein
LIKKILLFMDKYVLYQHLLIWVYGKFSSSIAEVEVSCMKEGNAVMPYARGISDKLDLKKQRKTNSALLSVSSMPLWSRSSSRVHVPKHTKGILQQQYLHSMMAGTYSHARTDSNTWLVSSREARQHSS